MDKGGWTATIKYHTIRLDIKFNSKDMAKKDKWVRPFEYARIKGTSVQNVYRWIREGKIKAENVQTVEITVKRKVIKVE